MTGLVHVVDDDEGVCGSLHFLLELKGYTVRSHTTVKGFLGDFKPEETICIISDMMMPGMSGLELQEHLVQKNVFVPLIIITGHGDVPSAVRALKSGALDFIEKPLESGLVLAAIGRAVEARRGLLAETRDTAHAKRMIEELTPRESEVLSCIVSGSANKIIAYELGISQRTVENHRARLMIKMQAENVVDLVKIAIAGGVKAVNVLDQDQGSAVQRV